MMHNACKIAAKQTAPVSIARRMAFVAEVARLWTVVAGVARLWISLGLSKVWRLRLPISATDTVGAMPRRSAWSACAWVGLIVGLCCSSVAVAQPGRDKEELSWDRNISHMFRRYCYSCHGADDPSGNVNLAQDGDPAQILRHQRTWATAVHVLQADEMPPEDERQPTSDERRLMLAFLEETLAGTDCADQRDPGRPVLRRLNNSEYDNAIADLTGLNLQLGLDFPPDPTGFGFDNNSEALSLAPAQVETFHAAAQKIVAALLAKREQQDLTAVSIFAVSQAELQDFAAQHAEPSAEKVEPSAETQRQQARVALTRFASRAFRQPVEEFYIQRLLQIYDLARQQSDSHDVAIGHGLTAGLMSPRFLLRMEADQPGAAGPYVVSDYELATRLSFFLWSRPPDEELLSVAASGRLHEPEQLRAQTVRMLGDPRNRALVDNFFSQWLDLRRLQSHQPDPDIFPEFDDALRQAMFDEANLILLEIISEDRPLTWLIDSDHTFANARLAEHYGLSGVSSIAPVQVALPDRRRGGLVSSAALLMLQSDPTRNNIPRRGNFIAGQWLGSPPPPPPPDVPPLAEAEDGSQRSMRETFELHRSHPNCQSCHAKIDPLGFSLENFDAIGRWRDTEFGLPIDASAELASGAKFDGIVGLKDFLLENRDVVLEELANRLLIYALGRGLQASDQCVVDRMVTAGRQAEYRFSAVVLELVTSIPFTHRQNPEY